MIKAAEKTKGMVYLAAELLGCSHTTVYRYIDQHPTVAAAFAKEDGKVCDTAELKLYQGILDGDHRSVTFYLSTKGKHRGYTKQTDYRYVDDTTVQEAIDAELARLGAGGPAEDAVLIAAESECD